MNIGGLATVLIGIGGIIGWGMSLVADYFQAKDGFEKSKNSETTTSIVETIEKNTESKKTKTTDVIEVSAVEQEEPETETEPPTEPQPKSVYLDSLKVADSHGFYEDENTAESTVGDTYSGHVVTIGHVGVLCSDGDEYAMYYLGGKYKKLSGTIAVNDKSWENGNSEILISCDDNIIYQTGAVGRATAPITLPEELSVEGCQWLKISAVSYTGYNGHDKRINFILSDFKLEE